MTTNKESPDKGAGAWEVLRDSVAAELSAVPQVRDLPKHLDEDVWPTVERALVAIGAFYRDKYAQDSGQGEAVAWRYRVADGQLNWNYRDYEPKHEAFEVQPLYAHPPKPAQGGEKYRAVTIEDAQEIWRAYVGDHITGDPWECLFAALQARGAVVPAWEGGV